MTGKTNPGNYFEDFRLGQILRHATPRTVSAGDSALYTALYGSRFAVGSSAEFARAIGFSEAPVDDLLAFHLVFGKTVPDISLNAVANLGYAEGRFGVPVYPGDTLTATSEVIGLKEISNDQTGVVYVRSTGTNQRGAMRWPPCRRSISRRAAATATGVSIARPVTSPTAKTPGTEVFWYASTTMPPRWFPLTS